MNNNTSIFIMDLVRYNFKIRHQTKNNNFFQNLSRKYIKPEFLTQQSKLNNLVEKKIINNINKLYNNIVNFYTEYLDNITFDEFIYDYENKNNTIIFLNNNENIYNNNITIYTLIQTQFSKGIDNLILLSYYINGISYIDNITFKCWKDINNKSFIIKNFIISFQVFGDGNHRTSKIIDSFFNSNNNHNNDIILIDNNRLNNNIITPLQNNQIEEFENNWIEYLSSNISP